LDRKLGGSQIRSGRGGEEKNFQPSPAIEPPIIQPVAQRYTAELSRPNYRNILFLCDENFNKVMELSMEMYGEKKEKLQAFSQLDTSWR
jgi:hypothetical protein